MITKGSFNDTRVENVKLVRYSNVIYKAESPLGGKCRGGNISCSLIGYSNLLWRKILAATSRDWFYFSQRDIFPPSGDSA